MTRPDRPSRQEILEFVEESWASLPVGVRPPDYFDFTKECIIAALAKWGQPAPKVEASEEEIRKFVNSFYAARIHPEGRERKTVEECVSTAITRFAPPAPHDAAKVEALIEAARVARKWGDGFWTHELGKAIDALRASRPVERRVDGIHEWIASIKILDNPANDSQVLQIECAANGTARRILDILKDHDAVREEE